MLARAEQSGILTKSGLIVGMGESMKEVEAVMSDLRSVRCEMLTIGQYLQPTIAHRPVSRFYDPSEFEALRNAGTNIGFLHIESGPLARSSYHAEQQEREARH